MKDRIVVVPDGLPAVTLTAADHLATGGEGAVYVQGDIVYKLYLDPDKAVAAGVDRKVAVLSAIRHPGIVAPRRALRDKTGRFVGIQMKRASGEPLSRLFTTAWRDAHGMDDGHTTKLVESMREVVVAAHQAGAVMADANELNWLAEKMTEARIIDVDSWQVGGYPATAIMPSIRDYAAAGISVETDWFAWAVVTFQLWTGVHPYKGVHPDFSRGALAERMKARASVFDPKVRLPAAARSVDGIPPRLRDWYARVFQTAERDAPPSPKDSAAGAQTVPRLRVRQTASGSVHQERIAALGGPVRGVFGGVAVYEEKGSLRAWDTLRRQDVNGLPDGDLRALPEGQAALVQSPVGRLYARLDAGRITFKRLEAGGGEACLDIHASRLWQTENRVFALVDHAPRGLLELDAVAYGDRLVAAVRTAWPLASLSTRGFRNVLVQDCLGTPFVAVPQGAGLVLARAPELAAYRLVDGFAADPANVWFVGIRVADGQTVLLRLRLDIDRFLLEMEELADQPALNASVTANGIGALLLDDRLEVFRGAGRRTVANPGIGPDWILFPMGASVGASAGAELIRLRLS